MSSSQLHTESSDLRVANRARFELELEFVQSLANPFYLHSLAQQGILNQPAFINFLKYLQYWKEKEYAQFLQSALFSSHSVYFRPMMLNLLLDTRMLSIILSCSSILNFGRRSVRMNGENTSTRNNLTTGVHGMSLCQIYLIIPSDAASRRENKPPTVQPFETSSQAQN